MIPTLKIDKSNIDCISVVLCGCITVSTFAAAEVAWISSTQQTKGNHRDMLAGSSGFYPFSKSSSFPFGSASQKIIVEADS